MKLRPTCFLIGFLFVFICTSLVAQSLDEVLVRVDLVGAVENISLPLYAHLVSPTGQEYALVKSDLSTLERSKRTYQILDYVHKKAKDESYFIALERVDRGGRRQASSLVTVLHDDGKQIVFRAKPENAEALCLLGFDIEEIMTPFVFAKNEVSRVSVAYDNTVAEMIQSIQKEKVSQYIGSLSGESSVVVDGASYKITSRYTKSGTPIQKATQYASEFMQKLGLVVSFHEWSSGSTSCRNVVGHKNGTTKPEEIILIVGHFDSMPSSSTDSPGADDNASGSVGVLLLAETLVKYNLARSVRFVLFTGEEQGLLGSNYYASKVAGAGEKIVAVYNMDMIAWDSVGSPTLRIHTRTTSNSGHAADKAIADTFTSVVSTYKLNLVPILDPDSIAYSDHASFWKKGFPGILAIEDDEDDFCRNYHTSRDRLATLNLNYCTEYIKASLGTVAHLAQVQTK